MTKKLKHGTTEYWMDWYWNRGGREKVQSTRKLREYIKLKQQQNAKVLSDRLASESAFHGEQ